MAANKDSKDLPVVGGLSPKPYLCDIHGERYGDIVFGSIDSFSTVFCGECLRLKLLELGLKPMTFIPEKEV